MGSKILILPAHISAGSAEILEPCIYVGAGGGLHLSGVKFRRPGAGVAQFAASKKMGKMETQLHAIWLHAVATIPVMPLIRPLIRADIEIGSKLPLIKALNKLR